MVSYCTPVNCKQNVPFFSLLNAYICVSNYLTVNGSKVAIVTALENPHEVIVEDREADPLWVTAAKISSYILLFPLPLLALLAQGILHCCYPLHLRTAPITEQSREASQSNTAISKETDKRLRQFSKGDLMELVPQIMKIRDTGVKRSGPEEEAALLQARALTESYIDQNLQRKMEFLRTADLREEGFDQEADRLAADLQLLDSHASELIEQYGDTDYLDELQKVKAEIKQLIDSFEFLKPRFKHFFGLKNDWPTNYLSLEDSIGFFNELQEMFSLQVSQCNNYQSMLANITRITWLKYTADSGKLGNLPTPKAADLHPIPPRLLLRN